MPSPTEDVVYCGEASVKLLDKNCTQHPSVSLPPKLHSPPNHQSRRFVLFIVLMVYFLVTSILGQAPWQKIAVYMAFFLGAITCLFCSFFFHTCACHSVKVANVCSKLDYSGITFLIVGSFVPWLYFGFYCEDVARAVYSTFIVVLGIVCLIVAMKDTFGSPKYRPFRAALFVSLGLSAVIPAIHYMIKNSLVHAIEAGAIGWMILMGVLYIGGATLYALRIPERFFPGNAMFGSQWKLLMGRRLRAIQTLHPLRNDLVDSEEMLESLDNSTFFANLLKNEILSRFME
ncbi:putative adiponectin receptor protein 1-like [Apostichopus japonicus]|uniref:Putative adiponectin receptor protein 1-like n=1 Tax=Stichopus japonicus TaxID=307972 RepID=A0A2G8LGR7_STIJA|nr:putative adiponectin receptor protein 1-like [Apostichopus japonicus]